MLILLNKNFIGELDLWFSRHLIFSRKSDIR